MVNAAYALFLLALLFSPLAFGAVETWSRALMEMLVFTSLCLFLLSGRKGRPALRETPGLLPLALFLLYILFQALPLPAGIVEILSPGAFAVYADTVGVMGPPMFFSLSLNGKATLTEFFRFASYGAFYLLTVQLLAGGGRLRRTVVAVAAAAAVIASLALVQSVLSPEELLFFREVPAGAHPFGPYVNRNHYANLMGMLFPLIFALYVFTMPERTGGGLRKKAAALLAGPGANAHVMLGLGAVLVMTSLLVSRSRGGIASSVFALLFFLALVPWKGRTSKKLVFLGVFLLFSGVAIRQFGWDPIFARFAKIRNAGWEAALQRPEIWKDVSQMVRDFPVSGTGFGTLVEIYPKYRTLPGEGILEHAHSDYLELLSDGGVVGTALLFWFVAAVLRRSALRALRRRDRYARTLAVGCFAGVLFFLFHGVVDFSLQVGANGLIFFFLLGLTVSVTHARTGGGRVENYLRRRPLSFSRHLLPAGVLLALCLAFNGGVLAAARAFSPLRGADIGEYRSLEELREAGQRLRRAAVLDPLEGLYPHTLGRVERGLGEGDGAFASHAGAVRLSPTRSGYLQRLALSYSDRGDFDEADRLFRAAAVMDRRSPVPLEVYGSWLLSRGDIDRGAGYLRDAIAREPGETERYLTTMVLYGLSDGEIRRALPSISRPQLVFADYLLSTGSEDRAEAAYLRAIEYLPREGGVKRDYFLRLTSFYLERERFEDALRIARLGVGRIPRDVKMRVVCAELYERLDDPSRAEEQYSAALALYPRSRKAVTGLERLRGKLKEGSPD